MPFFNSFLFDIFKVILHIPKYMLKSYKVFLLEVICFSKKCESVLNASLLKIIRISYKL